ncbi:MAG: branched-chain amino acid ABC transporter permease, partial [Methylobacteriaceae bacterium]|nr:branched-chain amino acid ABC transporter permease [Methylobacteriaceae bacterium]
GFLLQQLINALTIGAIYALIALGYTMVYGVLRLINFAHSEMFMVGAHIAFFLLAAAASINGGPIGIVLVFGVFVATFVAVGVLGVGIEAAAYRPLRGASRLAPMLSALGVAIVLQNVVMLFVSRRPLPFPPFLPAISFNLASAVITLNQGFIIVFAVGLMVGLGWFVNATTLGIKIRAVSENLQTAQLLGINVNRPISLIFFIGPGLGAVAGILYSSYYGIAVFSMGFIVGLKAFTAAILGGIGSIPGAMLGGFALGLLETFGAGLLPILTNDVIGSEYRDIFAFSVLVLVLLFRPSGFLGEAVTEEGMVYKRDF